MATAEQSRKVGSYFSPTVQTFKQKQRRKLRSRSILESLRDFFLQDSFMYGPLLSNRGLLSVNPGHEAQNVRQSASPSQTNDLSSVSNIMRLGRTCQERLHRLQGTCWEALDSLQMKTDQATARNILQSTRGTVRKIITSTLVNSPAEPSGDAELTELEGDDADEVDDKRATLETSCAQMVAQQLVKALGGRYSQELGINIAQSDSEVERWFLAANLFSRCLPFSVTRTTFKELAEAGVSNLTDMLSFDETKLAALLEKAGCGQRVASRLRQLAEKLEENNWGRVSTFKHVAGYRELVRQLRSLPGVKSVTARIFLCELQGVWEGVNPLLESKTRKAARHLQLQRFGNISADPCAALTELATGAGLDKRDLEVALVRFGYEHEHEYGTCVGGQHCIKCNEEISENGKISGIKGVASQITF